MHGTQCKSTDGCCGIGVKRERETKRGKASKTESGKTEKVKTNEENTRNWEKETRRRRRKRTGYRVAGARG